MSNRMPMKFGALYFREHPRLAFVIHSVTVCALGYLTHRLQLVWYPEPFLLLHISIWWCITVMWLLEMANRRVEDDLPGNRPKKLDPSIRPNALLFGRAPWFHDEEAESVTEDFPAGTPLFRSICLRVPPRWKWNSLSIDLGRPRQKATFGDNGSPVFTVDFENWDFAWMCSLIEVSGATSAEVSTFLIDLHRVLSATDGIERVQWYSGPTAFHAQMTPEELDRGFELPIDTDDRSLR